MNHFFITENQIADDIIFLEGPDLNHLKNVLRMKPGEKVLLSDEKKFSYLCEIEAYEEKKARLKILEKQEGFHELPSEIVLYQGLPKSDKMEWIIQKCVELGAARIVPVQMERSIVKWDEKKKKAHISRWQEISKSAAEQSKRDIIPEVSGIMTFKEALADSKSLSKVLIPYEEERGFEETKEILAEIQKGESIGVFIGPEGGISDPELMLAKENGVKSITLGKRILRTETAAVAGLSVLNYLLELR